MASYTKVSGGFTRSNEIKALVRNKADNRMELQSRSGYQVKLENDTISIQKMGDGAYTVSAYGMGTGKIYNTLKQAKANAVSDFNKIKERNPYAVASARAVYEDIMKTESKSVSWREYLDIERNARDSRMYDYL